MTIKDPIFTLQLETDDADEILDAIWEETRRFFGNVILWALEAYEEGRQNGTHNEGRFFSQQKLEQVAFSMLRDDAEEVFDAMTEVNPETNRYFGDHIFGEVLRELVDCGAVEYDPETGGVAFDMVLDQEVSA